MDAWNKNNQYSKTADRSRFVTYFTDYVIKNDNKVLAFRKQNGLPKRMYRGLYLDIFWKPKKREKKQEEERSIVLTKRGANYFKNNFTDYLFNKSWTRMVLIAYLYTDVDTFFEETIPYSQSLGIYEIVDNKLGFNLKGVKLKKFKEGLIEDIEYEKYYPVSIRISSLATKSSLLKFINERWRFIEKIVNKDNIFTDYKYNKIRSRTNATNYARLIILENEDLGLSTKELKKIIEDRTKRTIGLEQVRNLLVEIRKHKGK